jgi:predicted deacylase
VLLSKPGRACTVLWLLLMPSLLWAQAPPEPVAAPTAAPPPSPALPGTSAEEALPPPAAERPAQAETGTAVPPDAGAAIPTEAAADAEPAPKSESAEQPAAVEKPRDGATDEAPPAEGGAPHRAENIDLKEVVIDPSMPAFAPAALPEAAAATEPPAPAEPAPPAADDSTPPLVLLENEVPPATATRLAWSPKESFAGIAAPTPVLVINGARPGPVLCLTAAIHGDELIGIEVVRRLLYAIDPQQLSGALIGVPIVNLQGFRRSSRYLPDRRDLNRYFPGNTHGSSAARIAHSFFNEVMLKCDALVDLHTGSFHRTNLPQVRADLNNADVAALTKGFGATVVLQSVGARGSLRRAAVEAGIPAVTLEAGEPMRLDEEAVSHGVKSIEGLLDSLGMLKTRSRWARRVEPIYYKSTWVRANQGGVLLSRVELGERVRPGDLLGTVTDPITNASHHIVSPHNGRVIGMALNQVMMPGFAAYHIGIQATPEEAAEPDPTLDSGLDEIDDETIGPVPVKESADSANIEDSE